MITKKRKSNPEQLKECKKEFRCTFEEAQYISMRAEKMKMSESAYMRYQLAEAEKRAVRLPEEITVLLKEMNYQNIKIGTNINQIVRSCNSKKFITKEDYRKLIDHLAAIDEQCAGIAAQIKEVLKNGDHEAS